MPYIYKRLRRSVTVCTGATCDNCGGEIPLAVGNNADQALDLILEGWYGGFFDGRAKFMLCKVCAGKLVDTFHQLFPAIYNNLRGEYNL